ncbi:MAG: lipase family protein [Pseudomonadota bacterium]
MHELSPSQAAVLADDTYTLTRLKTIEQAVTYMKSEHGDVFSFGDQNVLKGRTGGPAFIKVRTAFGFTLLGRNKLAGHAVILFRGTQYLADWLTNLNLSVSRSASHQPVHDGFNQAFRSMEPQLRPFLDDIVRQGVREIHCVGHSLGGALATLCADWIHARYHRKAYVYTFGAPRVGLFTFAGATTKQLGAERIYRAYHRTDIVPCIPPWPFYHAPHPGQDYYLPSPGVVPLAEYHAMSHYIDSVRDRGWNALAALRAGDESESAVQRWLANDSPISLTITSIEWLNRALLYVLKKCADGAAWLLSQSFAASFTLIDQLAFILQKGVDLASSVSSWVRHLIRKIMQVLGLGKVLEGADITRLFLRNILMTLQQRVSHMSRTALSYALADGRGL